MPKEVCVLLVSWNYYVGPRGRFVPKALLWLHQDEYLTVIIHSPVKAVLHPQISIHLFLLLSESCTTKASFLRLFC